MSKEMKLGRGARLGRWILVGDKPLGVGGNADVWKAATDDGSQRAIKILKKNNFTDPGRQNKLARFIDEIRFLKAEAGRPGVLQLIDANCPDRPSMQDRPWLVTPIGTPFSNLHSFKPQTLEEVVALFQIAAQTLAGLHAEEKWHRDLKPENLLVVDGRPFIADFGLVDFPGKASITEPTEAMGPRFYMAPEMFENCAETRAGPADVFSLAKSLWVVATQMRFPLEGHLRSDERPLRLSTYAPHSRAPFLDRLIDHCTRHSPNDRPSMLEFADELAAWLNPTSADKNVNISAPLAQMASLMRERSYVEDRWTEMREHVRVTAMSLLEKIKPLASELSDAGLRTNCHHREFYGANCERHWEQSSLADSSKGLPFYCSQAELSAAFPARFKGETYICGGIALVLSENGMVELTARWKVGKGNGVPLTSVWTASESVRVSSAREELAVSSLLRLLFDSVPNALNEVRRIVERENSATAGEMNHG